MRSHARTVMPAAAHVTLTRFRLCVCGTGEPSPRPPRSWTGVQAVCTAGGRPGRLQMHAGLECPSYNEQRRPDLVVSGGMLLAFYAHTPPAAYPWGFPARGACMAAGKHSLTALYNRTPYAFNNQPELPQTNSARAGTTGSGQSPALCQSIRCHAPFKYIGRHAKQSPPCLTRPTAGGRCKTTQFLVSNQGNRGFAKA